MAREIVVHGALIFLFLGVLLKGSDWFLEGAVAIAQRLSIHPYWIGMTIVSIGTSLPELAASVAGILKRSPSIMVGTVVGSNVVNLALVAGVGILIKPLHSWSRREATAMGVMVASSLFLWGVSFFTVVPHWVGVAMLGAYIAYLWILKGSPDEVREEKEDQDTKEITPFRAALWGIGLVMVIVGSNQAVDHALKLAALMNVNSGFIALIIISVGTSLPELGVTVSSALKGHGEIMLGNVVGSNVANILLISGLSFAFAKVGVSPAVRMVALPYMVLVAVLFMVMSRIKRRLSRLDGALLLIAYGVFLVLSFTYLTGK